MSYEEEERYQVYCFLPQGFLTRDYLMEKAADLCGHGKMVASLNIKAMLRHMDIREHTAMFDAGIAAYLLNPLKSQYTYDDIAKEYLGEILPAKEDLIGKLTYLKAARDESYEQEVAKSICYMAYVALKSRKPLLEALEDTGMKKLFTDIEMPLLFTLSDMEKEGIRVNAEELKEYGEKLQVRIEELEKKIWEEAGEEFNINSPKQLGVILLKR